MRIALAAAVLLYWLGLAVAARADSAVEGYSGLLNVPSAEVVDNGRAVLGVGRYLNTYLTPGHTWAERTYFFCVGYLPGLELTGRFADFPTRPDSLETGSVNYMDRSAAVKYQLWSDEHWALAAGALDVGGESRKNVAYYGVATYDAGPKLQLTLGTGSGSLEGVFGGARWTPWPEVSLVAEHDTETFNYGLEVRPLHDWTLKGGWIHDHPAFIAAYSFPLDPRGKGLQCAPVELSRTAEEYPDLCSEAAAVRDCLTAESFENVLVGSDGETLYIEYENRRFREQLDALGVVCAVASQHCGPAITRFVITPKIEDVPQLTLHTGVDELLAFLAAPGGACPLRISSYLAGGYPESTVFASEGNRKPGHGDVQLRYFNSLVITSPQQPAFRVSNGLALDEQWFLGRGLKLRARQDWPLQNDIEEKTNPLQRELYLNYFGGYRGLSFQANAGYYGRDRYGLTAEAALPVDRSGRFELSGRTASFATQDQATDALSLKDALFLGQVSYSVPELDLRMMAQAGRFQKGDEGLRFESTRYFGPVELTFFAYDTDNSFTEGGFRFFVPLAWYSEKRHGAWRAVGAPTFGWQYRSDSHGWGDYPLVGNDLEAARQRLRPDYVRAHLDDLRRAVALYLGGD